MEGIDVIGVPFSSKNDSSLSKKGRLSTSLPMSYNLLKSVEDFCVLSNRT